MLDLIRVNNDELEKTKEIKIVKKYIGVKIVNLTLFMQIDVMDFSKIKVIF